MANTYVALAKTVLTSTQTTVTFSSIVQTYTDLAILISARGVEAGVAGNLYVRVNGDTGTNYSRVRLYGYGSSAQSQLNSNQSTFADASFYNQDTSTSNTFSNVELYIPSYTTSTNKIINGSSVVENNSTTDNAVAAHAYLYRGSSAITSISIIDNSTGFASGSSFYLYGIKNS